MINKNRAKGSLSPIENKKLGILTTDLLYTLLSSAEFLLTRDWKEDTAKISLTNCISSGDGSVKSACDAANFIRRRMQRQTFLLLRGTPRNSVLHIPQMTPSVSSGVKLFV